MPDRKNLCVLAANALADDSFVARLGSTEASHAAERCLNRIERAIAAHGGRMLQQQGRSIVAAFERCDTGVLAASDMLERIRNLPSMNGLRQPVRIGLHYGIVDPSQGSGEGIDIARRIAAHAESEQALASSTAVLLLTPAARHTASAHPLQAPALQALDWPIYAIGQRMGTVTSIPPTARLSQRLRLRHQQDVVFVEEQRPVLLLGRELGNDIVIMDPRASRQHARIERQREGFTLIDESTNGTFVSVEGGEERRIRHDKLVLRGPGRIGCGFSADEIERDLVFFDIV
ncbi:FHA domain-containing protein [Thauera sp. Sel9]|uniref:FHA domain-containing protein n=1 Tax=Thauera sp. Sel9 TaxID=2974299 RepID=UPI0021E1A7BF|nr:FHA domain-containing protein [Thauera sp. Sel9]MCV2217219.1 FHA domain-containing protein [Thauera sp. Sel9]